MNGEERQSTLLLGEHMPLLRSKTYGKKPAIFSRLLPLQVSGCKISAFCNFSLNFTDEAQTALFNP